MPLTAARQPAESPSPAGSEPVLNPPCPSAQAPGNSSNCGPAAAGPCPEWNGSATVERLPCEALHPPPPALQEGCCPTTHPSCLAPRLPPVRRHRAHRPGRGLRPAGRLPARAVRLPGPHRQAAELHAARPRGPGREDSHQRRCVCTQGDGRGPGWGGEAGPGVTRLPPQTSPSRSAGSAATWPSWWAPA